MSWIHSVWFLFWPFLRQYEISYDTTHPEKKVHVYRVHIAMTDLIQSAPIVIIAKSYCPTSLRLIDGMKALKIPDDVLKIYFVDTMFSVSQLVATMSALKKLSNICTVPQVYINSKFISNGDDTMAAIQNGSFQRRISTIIAAGAKKKRKL